jgi:hypothetical protein
MLYCILIIVSVCLVVVCHQLVVLLKDTKNVFVSLMMLMLLIATLCFQQSNLKRKKILEKRRLQRKEKRKM